MRRYSVASRSHQKGFILLSAIFVLVFCSILSLVLVTQIERDTHIRSLHYTTTQAYLSVKSALDGVRHGQCDMSGGGDVVSLGGLRCQLNFSDAGGVRSCSELAQLSLENIEGLKVTATCEEGGYSVGGQVSWSK